ncbi:MAG: hypothetical protein ACYTEP_12725 [Planctomycetota bacterium]|jgi:hypothetical protein
MLSRILLASLPLITIASSLWAAEPLLVDDFSKPKMAGRRAMRGDWMIANGVAKVTQDDALYKKYKDHGPIIFYDVDHQDAVIEFSYKPVGVKSFVFTVNGADGHVFRTVTSERGTDFRAFPPDAERKSISLHRLPRPILQGEWTRVRVELEGAKATVTVGDHEPVSVEHGSLDRAKINTSVGFSFGSLEVKNFSVR